MEKFRNLKLWQIILIAVIIVIGVKTIIPHNSDTVEKQSYNKVSHSSAPMFVSKKSIPSDYVKVPDTYFKQKSQVEEDFKQAGITANFIAINFDSKSEINGQKILTGMCDQINEQSNLKYFSASEYESYGDYAKKGSTITVGYSDHDYNPKSLEIAECRTSSKKESDKNSSKEKVVYYKYDNDVNNFYEKYNALKSITFSPSEIARGNIDSKSLASKDDISFEVGYSGTFLYVSINTDSENQDSKMYPIFSNSIKAVISNINDQEIKSVWDSIHRNGFAEDYEFKGMKITYLEKDWLGQPRIDINFPDNN